MKAKVAPHANSSLHKLDPAVLERIDSKLLSGEGGLGVARWLQEECGLFKGERTDTVKKRLERYREKELRNKTLARIAHAQAHIPVKVVERRLNALEEMDELVRIQRGRLDKLLVKEAELPAGIILDKASSEIRLLKDMLVNLGQIQLETGYIARAPKKIVGQITDEAGVVKEFAWTEEQEKLFQELEGVDEHAAEDIE